MELLLACINYFGHIDRKGSYADCQQKNINTPKIIIKERISFHRISTGSIIVLGHVKELILIKLTRFIP
jgi:hypothetical protein